MIGLLLAMVMWGVLLLFTLLIASTPSPFLPFLAIFVAVLGAGLGYYARMRFVRLLGLGGLLSLTLILYELANRYPIMGVLPDFF